MSSARSFSAVAALAFTLAACSDHSITGEPRLDNNNLQTVGEQHVTLAVGETATVGSTGLRITFTSLDNDSRCPAGFYCITQGDAQISLVVKPANGSEIRAPLHTLSNPRSLDVGGYRVQISTLDPLPHSGVKVPESEYRAKLSVTKLR
jgi:hypothetical protein